MGETDDHHVGGGERTRRCTGFVDAFEEHLPGAGQRPQRQLFGEVATPAALLLGQHLVLGGGGGELQPRDNVSEGGKVLQHHRRVGADVMKVLEQLQSGGGVAGHDRLEQVDHQPAVGKAEYPAHFGGGDAAVGMGDCLVEEGQGVAGRTLRRPRQHGERRLVDGDVLFRRDVAHEGHQAVGLDPPEVETLAARKDGDRDLAHLGGREDELHVLGRLFQRLQQAVEGLLGEHVHLVDDVDLVAARSPACSAPPR